MTKKKKKKREVGGAIRCIASVLYEYTKELFEQYNIYFSSVSAV